MRSLERSRGGMLGKECTRQRQWPSKGPGAAMCLALKNRVQCLASDEPGKELGRAEEDGRAGLPWALRSGCLAPAQSDGSLGEVCSKQRQGIWEVHLARRQNRW